MAGRASACPLFLRPGAAATPASNSPYLSAKVHVSATTHRDEKAFSTASRAPPRHASAVPRRSAGSAKWPRGNAWTETGCTTRPMASAGKGGGLSAPGASAVARPLSRGGAAESSPPPPGGCPRYRQAAGDPP